MKKRHARVSGFAALARIIAAIRDYRRAMIELDGLTDHDLRDLKIARADISHVSWCQARRTSGLGATVESQGAPAARAGLVTAPAVSR